MEDVVAMVTKAQPVRWVRALSEAQQDGNSIRCVVKHSEALSHGPRDRIHGAGLLNS